MADVESPTLEPYFRPVRSGNAFEDTVQRLLQLVRLGIVSPGEGLPPERELAARLAISRDTLREAIGALVQAGFLVSKRGRYGGTRVADVLPATHTWVVGTQAGAEWPAPEVEVLEALAVREVLEVGVARLAARSSMSATDRERLADALKQSQEASLADYRRLDAKFHLAIAELAGSSTLIALVADNRMLIDRYLGNIPMLPPNIAHSNAQHERILSAILAADEAAAAAAMQEHLDGTAALLRGFLA